jgi:hypothetical protein
VAENGLGGNLPVALQWARQRQIPERILWCMLIRPLSEAPECPSSMPPSRMVHHAAHAPPFPASHLTIWGGENCPQLSQCRTARAAKHVRVPSDVRGSRYEGKK